MLLPTGVAKPPSSSKARQSRSRRSRAGDVQILGPSTVRVSGLVDTGTLASTVYIRYGEGSVLNQRTASFTLGAGLEPTKVIEDLLDLEPGSSYNVQLVAETPLGTVPSNSIPFTLPAAVYVNPSTGGVVSGTSKGGQAHPLHDRGHREGATSSSARRRAT